MFIRGYFRRLFFQVISRCFVFTVFGRQTKERERSKGDEKGQQLRGELTTIYRHLKECHMADGAILFFCCYGDQDMQQSIQITREEVDFLAAGTV